jgi:hypothetical protein
MQKTPIFSTIVLYSIFSISTASAGNIDHPIFGPNSWVDDQGLTWSPLRVSENGSIKKVNRYEAFQYCDKMAARLPAIEEFQLRNQEVLPDSVPRIWIWASDISGDKYKRYFTFNEYSTFQGTSEFADQNGVRCVIDDEWKNYITPTIEKALQWHKINQYIGQSTEMSEQFSFRRTFFEINERDAALFLKNIEVLEIMKRIEVPTLATRETYAKVAKNQLEIYERNRVEIEKRISSMFTNHPRLDPAIKTTLGTIGLAVAGASAGGICGAAACAGVVGAGVCLGYGLVPNVALAGTVIAAKSAAAGAACNGLLGLLLIGGYELATAPFAYQAHLVANHYRDASIEEITGIYKSP